MLKRGEVSEGTQRSAKSEREPDARSAASETSGQGYEFGPFLLEPAERKLWRGNDIVALTPKAFDTLLVLVRNSGRLVEKGELLRILWPDTFVEEGSLSNNIFLLRKALGGSPALIETVPRRGYRFAGTVRQVSPAAPGELERPADLGTLSAAAIPATGPPNSRAMGFRPRWRSLAVLTIAAAAVAVSLMAAGWVYRFGPRRQTIDSVAVLPFTNATGDSNAEYLSDGITESLIDRLSRLPQLKVISKDATFRYKGKQTDAQKVGRELRVGAVFTGRVTERGDNLEISAELIDPSDNSQIWGERYSRKLSDIFALQVEVAREMAGALRVRLTGEDEKRLIESYTARPEAYQVYLKGRYWLNKSTTQGVKKGVEYFQQAIKGDPGYALAYSGLADCYTFLAREGVVSAKEGYSRAKETALRALEVDDTLAEAHVSLAYVEIEYEWDWPAGQREAARALELDPSYAPGHDAYAEALWLPGRLDEGIAESKQALALDPLSIYYNDTLGLEFFLWRRYDQAIEQEGKTLELDPDFIEAYYFRGMAYLKKSMFREGMAEFEKAVTISPDDLGALTGLGYGYGVTGRRTEAEKVLDKLDKLSGQRYVSPVWRAKIYSGLGDKDKAFEWLEKAMADRSIVSVGYIKTNPMFDPLRSDPRFADVLRRTHLWP